MKHFFVLLAVACCFTAIAQPDPSPSQSITLTVIQETGTNGAAVAYNPTKRMYYCAIAGNTSYPLEAFSKNISTYQGSTGFDARGLWYNEKENTLEGNAYSNDGIYSIQLDSKGLPDGEAEFKYSGGQPDDQSVGTCDTKTGILYYFDWNAGTVVPYKKNSAKPGKPIEIKRCPADFEDIGSAMIYTGQKGYEFGLYDFVTAKVYFFDKKGNYTATSTLDVDAPYNESFNFSYANGHIFVFDTDLKEWWGYKVF